MFRSSIFPLICLLFDISTVSSLRVRANINRNKSTGSGLVYLMRSVAVGPQVTETWILDAADCFELLKNTVPVLHILKRCFLFFSSFVGCCFPTGISFFGWSLWETYQDTAVVVSLLQHRLLQEWVLPHPLDSSPLRHHSVVYLADGPFHPTTPYMSHHYHSHFQLPLFQV